MRFDPTLTSIEAITLARDGHGERSLQGPPFKAVKKSPNFYPQKIRPFGNTQCSSIKCNPMVSALVQRLFLECRPAAITRLIISIVIDSINRVFGAGTRPHITIERFKRLVPLSAYDYSTCPIEREFFNAGILTSSPHTKPRLILGCFAAIVGSDSFCEQTAARSYLTSRYVVNGNSLFLTTDALPLPSSRSPRISACIAHGSKSPKLFSSSNAFYTSDSHDLNLGDRLGLWLGSFRDLSLCASRFLF